MTSTSGEEASGAIPFVIGKDGDRQEVIDKYEDYLFTSDELMSSVGQLYGKTLCCYCAPAPCHGDVLARYAMLTR